ncbi:MAG: hypothetical protein ACRCTY_09810 [Candidatus Adiutrix sp.]
MGLMTQEEKNVVLDAIRAAEVAGDYEEASHLMRHVLPLAPHLAMAAKEMYGKEYLIVHGYNLAEADKEFGDGWLDK